MPRRFPYAASPSISLLPLASMLTKDCLPLIDLANKQSAVIIVNVQHAILRYGAFRLRAPELKRAFDRCVQQNVSSSFPFKMTFYVKADFQQARDFFQLPMRLKDRTTGYSAFGAEIIRGKAAAKESVYFFRKNDREENHIPPPSDLYRSIKAIHDVGAPCLRLWFTELMDLNAGVEAFAWAPLQHFV